jgi:hypothetical protein
MRHPQHSCTMAVGKATRRATSAIPFNDDELLAFVATRPGLRRLELLTPMAAEGWSRLRRKSGPFFLALLSESCPRLECLKLTMLCRLDSLVRDSCPAPPAFPALRCLDIGTFPDWYVTLRTGKGKHGKSCSTIREAGN